MDAPRGLAYPDHREANSKTENVNVLARTEMPLCETTASRICVFDWWCFLFLAQNKNLFCARIFIVTRGMTSSQQDKKKIQI